ncbi:MAG: FadR family transcriptional regulator [Clostridia bacterium]|nr:FadR family transcriptional regulator [Clostridia bacterium]
MFDKEILSQKIADNIKDLIKDKKLQPEDKLPNELELAEELNVSRSTVREAIKILVSKNILEVKRGKGTFVSENPGIIKDPLGVTFMNEQDLHHYLFETRLIIEPEIVALCVDRIDEDQLEELEAAFEKMKDKLIKKEDHTEWDKKFHCIIAESTGNPIVKRIVPIISDSITEGYKKTRKRPKSGEIVLKNHQRLLEAIKEKDREKAKDWMKTIILYGMEK